MQLVRNNKQTHNNLAVPQVASNHKSCFFNSASLYLCDNPEGCGENDFKSCVTRMTDRLDEHRGVFRIVLQLSVGNLSCRSSRFTFCQLEGVQWCSTGQHFHFPLSEILLTLYWSIHHTSDDAPGKKEQLKWASRHQTNKESTVSVEKRNIWTLTYGRLNV